MQDIQDVLATAEWIELIYPDIHAIPRGKVIPRELFDQICEEGCYFSRDSLIIGLANNPTITPGFGLEGGFSDIQTKPLLNTLKSLPWDPKMAWCILSDIENPNGFFPFSPRALLQRVEERFMLELGCIPIVGPELEFYLFHLSEQNKVELYAANPSMMYTVGKLSDPQGVVRDMIENAWRMGLLITTAHHEYGCGQFEINMKHGTALDAADRTFIFKRLVKERANAYGLQATFLGKPFDKEACSAFHIHLSLQNREGANTFASVEQENDLSRQARFFLAGVLKHASALMAFLVPTVNGYRRWIQPDNLVPTAANWAYDNRTVFARVPPERGSGTRIEFRIGDGAANPYLAFAAVLLAGLDGIKQEMELCGPAVGEASPMTLPNPSLPITLEASLAALRADIDICSAIGWPLTNVFCDLKKAELEYFDSHISSKDEENITRERNYYMWHL